MWLIMVVLQLVVMIFLCDCFWLMQWYRMLFSMLQVGSEFWFSWFLCSLVDGGWLIIVGGIIGVLFMVLCYLDRLNILVLYRFFSGVQLLYMLLQMVVQLIVYLFLLLVVSSRLLNLLISVIRIMSWLCDCRFFLVMFGVVFLNIGVSDFIRFLNVGLIDIVLSFIFSVWYCLVVRLLDRLVVQCDGRCMVVMFFVFIVFMVNVSIRVELMLLDRFSYIFLKLFLWQQFWMLWVIVCQVSVFMFLLLLFIYICGMKWWVLLLQFIISYWLMKVVVVGCIVLLLFVIIEVLLNISVFWLFIMLR